jgi:hypothetical protein
MWASAMANLIAQEAITVDLETEQWIRRTIDAPLKLGDRPDPDAEQDVTDTADTQDTTEDDSADQKGNVRTNDPTQGQGNMPKTGP